jgi:histidinol-phosphate aminotransferase
VGNGETVAALFPTYTLYETLAELFNAKIVYYTLDDDLKIPPALLKKNDHRIICLPNPNPPYGTLYDIELIEEICRNNPDSLVIVDEAYVDFAPFNALPLLERVDNAFITRSFSKSYGMAGLRVGIGLGSPEIVATLDKVKDSYNVNYIAQTAAATALADNDYYEEIIGKIITSREYLTNDLEKLGFEVTPSAANFVFARWKDNARFIYDGLKSRKILVRYFNHPSLSNGLRISIGTEDENSALIAALKEIMENGPGKAKTKNRRS